MFLALLLVRRFRRNELQGLLAVYFWRTHKEDAGESAAEQKIYRSNKIEHEERSEDVATVIAGETCLIVINREYINYIYTETRSNHTT